MSTLLPLVSVYCVCMCDTHQELQQSVCPVDTVDNFIHVLYWSLSKLLHHEENVDQQSAEDLGVTEECLSILMYYNSIITGTDA